MNLRSNDKPRGSLTVEAVLVIPIILFVLFWLINIAFVLYQYAALQSYANQGVEAAQAGWDNTSKDIRTGRLENSEKLNDEWLYWNLFDRYKDKKEKSLSDWITKRVQEDRLMDIFTGKVKQGDINVEVNEKSLLTLRRSIEVRIEDNRITLFSPLRTMFGFDITNKVIVVSQGTLHDPAELIRNLDWGTELYSKHIHENPSGNAAQLINRIEEIKELFSKVLD